VAPAILEFQFVLILLHSTEKFDEHSTTRAEINTKTLTNFALDPSLRYAAWFNKSTTERDFRVDAIPSI
jgi:hypothetical protein